VDVDPERLARWLDGFATRHGETTVTPIPDGIRITAVDGAVAECHLPVGAAVDADELVAEALRERRLGLLLVRRGRYVQSRTAAGGWSQQRFARRRDNQARAAAGDTADVVARLLLPAIGELDALVAGGDRRLVDEVLGDPRLAPVKRLRVERFLDVPDPRLTVLKTAVTVARAVRIRVL
jgi:Actinobacteria/chloroflexi VLRF1 release factor